MAEIPIRSYLHEVEKHIESGRTDQAISHSRYILQYYPKFVDAYRLLGKAYLESQRYTDAGDIFQRVLSSVPDDFVAHAGMSIIREDEGNFDEAIWHMERAFEVQPSNNAIQEELRRLYSKRDNVEPPKIRLTRGALARLYYKGELYQQAIGEIRAALGESPNRLDLQALLADIYIKTNQRVEAADTALAVLRRLPNCMIAIRVMIRVLVGADREPEQKSYRQRLAQLDPYSAFTTPEDPSSESVQDGAVRLEKLDWKPDQVLTDASTPAWAASLGVDLADLAPSTESTLPDWLEDLSSQTPQEEFAVDNSSAAFPFGEIPESPPAGAGAVTASLQPEEDIPDWLREAGWQPTTEEPAAQESISQFEQVEGIAESPDQIAEAEIPDWLQAMKPPQEAPVTAAPAEEDVSPWLEKLIPAESAESEALTAESPPEPEKEEKGAPDWLIAAGLAGVAIAAAEPVEGKEEAAAIESLEEDQQPEWMRAAALGGVASMAFDEEPEQIPPVDEEIFADVDQGTETLGEPVEAAGADLPFWLMDSGTIPQEDETLEAEMAKDLPDWIIGTEQTSEIEPEPAGETPYTSDFTGQEMPDWLLEAVQEEEPVSEFESESPTPPEEAVVGQIPDWLLETSQESLSEEQGAAMEWEATGEDVETELPDWLMESQQPQEGVETPAVEELAFEPEAPAEPGIEAAVPAWLLASQIESSESQPEEIKPPEEIPAWLTEMEPAAASTGESLEEKEMEEPSDIEVPDWLMESYTEPERPEAEEASLAEIPSWLLDTQEVKTKPEPQAQIEPAEELEISAEIPDWLSSVEEEGTAEATPVEELPEWLVEMKEPELPQPEVLATPTETVPETPVQEIEQKPAEEDTLEEAFAWLMGLHVVSEAVKPSETEELAQQPEQIAPAVPTSEPESAIEPEPAVKEIAEFEEEPTTISEPISLDETVSETAVPILDEGSIDQDEAFAWLESLAVKQGASEALLLAPEERMESMPEWVKQDALAAEAEKEALAVEEEAEAFTEEPAIPEQTISEDETVFDGSPILKAAGAALILDELVEHEPEPAVAEVTEEISEQIPEEVLTEPAISAIEEPLYAVEAAPQELEEIPEVWEETEAAPEELETAEAAFEPAFEAGAESAPLEEEIPELPDWLTETAVAPREELEWTPPPIPQRRYELNEASLSELERIPGIGFITAQNIIIYREENGPFKSVDDLTRIPGITPSTIEGARDYLYVTEAELEISEPVQLEEEPFVLPEAEEISTELVKAREALTQGNLEQALDRYAQMIRTNQELNHIVQDLQEASYRFSDDPSVWQNLGDAYLRQEQVQEALQAYIKAEQLLL